MVINTDVFHPAKKPDAECLGAIREAIWNHASQESWEWLLEPLEQLYGAPVSNDDIRAVFNLMPPEILGRGIAYGFNDPDLLANLDLFFKTNRDPILAAIKTA